MSALPFQEITSTVHSVHRKVANFGSGKEHAHYWGLLSLLNTSRKQAQNHKFLELLDSLLIHGYEIQTLILLLF